MKLKDEGSQFFPVLISPPRSPSPRHGRASGRRAAPFAQDGFPPEKPQGCCLLHVLQALAQVLLLSEAVLPTPLALARPPPAALIPLLSALSSSSVPPASTVLPTGSSSASSHYEVSSTRAELRLVTQGLEQCPAHSRCSLTRC